MFFCVSQNRRAEDPSPQFIRNYFSGFANDPILSSLTGVEKLEASTPDAESDEKEKLEEMEKETVQTRSEYSQMFLIVAILK
jgi:hypothetical protein